MVDFLLQNSGKFFRGFLTLTESFAYQETKVQNSNSKNRILDKLPALPNLSVKLRKKLTFIEMLKLGTFPKKSTTKKSLILAFDCVVFLISIQS